ncbi:MAG TPA: extracellular solute-binding protein [candidate division Zixibacteria bacterium]|nr:extracellular solute-binding protein [candidate division Zixibacteria bacterium]
MIRLQQIVVSLFTMGLVAGGTVAAFAQDRDAIVAKAKEERSLVYYSTADIRDGTALVHAFQKKHPFVQPKLFRLGSTQVVIKVLQEHRAGVHLFDVISATSFQFYEIFKEGLFQRYDSPERKAFLEDFKDKDDFWTSAYHNASVIAYNTTLVKPADLPKSYDDLLDPKWKGKMLMDNRETEWYASMLQILGREKGLRLMRGLAKQDLSFRPGRTLITQVLASGEAPLAVNNYHHLVQAAKKRGAPVESIPASPVISRITPIALGRYAPHPNVGRLFIDFCLSEEGQKILRSFGRSSARKGIEPDELQRKGVKLYVSDINLAKDYARYDKEFREIFGLK